MTRRQPGVAALAMAAALLAPWPAAASPLDDAEREASAVEARLAAVEEAATRPEESPAARAARKFAEGETQFLLGDWVPAAVLLTDAVEQPEFRASADYPQALAWLGDALRHQGACASALVPYQELLALGATSSRGAAVAGALDCRVRLRRFDGVDALVAEARSAYPRGAPPEVGYLVAKAIALRPDLPPAERRARAAEAFAAVAPPFHLAAAYWLGALAVEGGDLDVAVERFERCISLEGKDERQVEIRERCMLALGRIHADQGRWAESLDRYRLVPPESPRFNEALYEEAWGFVKAKAYEDAVRAADMIVDLAPDSQLAPEATILTGHLNLRLGHYAASTEAFNKVINTYAPVRDEIDAILTMHEDPIRYFNDLLGRQGKAFDVASVLPDVAVKWAAAQRDVGGAMELVSGLDGGRRDVDDANAIAVRVEALLARAGGLEAAPSLRLGWAAADAVETGAARLEGELAAQAAAVARPALGPDAQAELDRATAARQALQPRIDALPATPEEVEARQARMQRRLDEVERGRYLLGLQARSAAASIAGTEAWLEQHRTEIVADDTGRLEFAEDLRRQRAVALNYQVELKALDREVAAARDAARSVESLAGEAALRQAYREAAAHERSLAEAAGPSLPPAAQAQLARGAALAGRLDGTIGRAEALKERLAAAARARAEAVQARLAAQRTALADEQAALDAVAGDSRDVIGRIAYRSFSAVRAQFYKLVLKADVGIIDVAWSRKRERLDRIQQLSQQKAGELEQLDRDFKLVLREVD